MRVRDHMFLSTGGAACLLFKRSLLNSVRADSLLRNSIYMMMTAIMSGAVGYVFWVVAARMYSVRDVGLASALIQTMLLASMLSNLGVHSTLVQVLPRRAAGYAWSVTVNAGLAMGTLTGLLAGGIAVLVLPLSSPQFAILGQQASYRAALIIGVPLWTVSLVLDQTFVAERVSGYMLARQALFAVLRVPILVLPALLMHAGAFPIFVSWILAAGASVAWGVLLIIPRLRSAYCLALRGLAPEARSLASSFARNHLINLGGALRVYLLPAFVATQIPAREYAYFFTAWMLANIFSLVSPAVATSLFAEGSHAVNDVVRQARSAALLTGMLLGPAMLATVLGGRTILSSFGPSYAQHGVVLLLILVASAVPDALTNLYVSVLRVQGHLGYAALLNLGMAAVTLALAWALLPVLGITGAGLAWLIGQIAGSAAVGIHILASGRRLRWFLRGAEVREPEVQVNQIGASKERIV